MYTGIAAFYVSKMGIQVVLVYISLQLPLAGVVTQI